MKKIIGFGIAAAAALSLASIAPQAHAATSGTVGINASIDPVLTLTLDQATVSFDFDNVAAEGGESSTQEEAITGSVQSNTPAVVNVKAEAAGDGKLNPSDIAVGGIQELSTEDQQITSVSHNSLQTTDFAFDVTVSNADQYQGSNTAYTNTLTFTAVAGS